MCSVPTTFPAHLRCPMPVWTPSRCAHCANLDKPTLPVAADESAYSAANVARLIEMRAVNVINIKLMKSGFVEALDIAAVCRANHIQLMIGAMMESRLATSAAAHFVAGLGGFRFIDLGTPMLLAEDPFTGGYVQMGGMYDLTEVERGLGVERK